MNNIQIIGLILASLVSINQNHLLANIIEPNILKSSTKELNAPVLNIYESEDGEGIKVIKVDAYDNPYESGIEKVELPDGTFVMVEDGEYAINTQYIPSSSGTYTFKAYDKNGNVAEESITINLNDIPPALDVYIQEEDIYANTVTIQATSWVEVVGGAKLSRLELPDGSTVLADDDNPYNLSATYTATRTGNYTFKSYDKQGLCAEKSLFIQLDDNAPNIEVFTSNSVTDPSKRIINIDAWDNDYESGIERVEGPNNTVFRIENDGQYAINVEYTPTKEGEHTFRAYDRAGNYTDITIDFSNNIELPKIASRVDINDNTALITLDVWTENGNRLSKIKMPDGSVIYANPDEYSKTITFEANVEGNYDFMVIDCMGYSAKERISITLDDFKIDEATKLVEKAESTRNPADIEIARTAVNDLLESASKDLLQNRLNAISVEINFEKQSATANVDVYIQSENMLSLSLDTNIVAFDDFSGVEDVEKLNAVNLVVSSSLPYEVNAYLASEIQNNDKSKTIDKNILNIRANGEMSYKAFFDTTNPLMLLDSQSSGNDITHGIDLKLKGNIAHEKDIYKTTIKFEVKQK